MDPQKPTVVPDTTQPVSHVTEELYKKNFELAETNKTLSLLRKIDDIILGSITDIQQIAQQVTNILSEEAIFPVSRVYLVEKENKVIRQLTISESEPVHQAEKELGVTFHKLLVPLTDSSNLLVQAVNEKRRMATHVLFEVLTPMFNKEQSERIQDIFGVRSTLVLPLIARGEVIGILTINLAEDYEKLTAYQEDLLNRLVDMIGIALDKAILYKEVQEANEQLKALDKLKDEFISITSHELRTPMNAVKSYLWMVINKANALPEDKRKLYLERAYLSSDHLIALVNDMLNISRIESGRIVLMPGIVVLDELVREIADELRSKVDEKHINLIINTPLASETSQNSITEKTVMENAKGLPKVYGDKDKIREILINLLSNAIKYTQIRGTIQITICEKNGMIETVVKDNGRGFKKEDGIKLFSKFGRLHNSLTDVAEEEGTGLGLYIAKQFVDLSKGKIWAESEGEGKGASFGFTLPIYTNQPIFNAAPTTSLGVQNTVSVPQPGKPTI